MRKHAPWLGLVAAVGLLTASARAQTPTAIHVDLSRLYRNQNLGNNNTAVGISYATPAIGQGATVQGFQPTSWAEFTVTCNDPGLYKIDLLACNYQDPNTVLAFESRPVTASPEDPYVTQFATVDTKNFGKFAASDTDFQNLSMVDANNNTLTVPLWQGVNVIRVWNMSDRQSPLSTVPPKMDDEANTGRFGYAPDDRPWHSGPWSNVRFADLTLTKTDPMPPMGTITGTITGAVANAPSGVNIPASWPVRDAYIAANPPGGSPSEIGPFWRNGWYTRSKPDGTYTLSAPVGTVDVMAGRPDSYLLPGVITPNVTVPATGSATANAQLTSTFTKDLAGNLTGNIQTEYFTSTSGNQSLFNVDGQNGYKVGYIDAGDSITVLVDAPVAGLYHVHTVYDNGAGTGTFSISSEYGPSVQGTQPGTGGWAAVKDVDAVGGGGYSTPIFLKQGPQLITQRCVAAASDFDAINFTLLPDQPTVGTLTGTITDQNGKPISGATVALTVPGQNGAAATTLNVTTNAQGQYTLIADPQTNGAVSITVPFKEYNPYPVTRYADITTGQTTTLDVQVPTRARQDLSSVLGYNWTLIPNTGGTADFSAVSADETNAVPITVPANWQYRTYTANGTVNRISGAEIYGWYRLHFQASADLAAAIKANPSRLLVLQMNADDNDVAYLNGTKIGATGSMPNPPLAPQANPAWTKPTGVVPFSNWYFEPGVSAEWGPQRQYYFPASLLNLTGDNVLAIQVYNDESGGGITGTPYIALAPPTGAVSGTVTVDGAPAADVRVTGIDAYGLASDWTMTDASGAYTLSHVFSGPSFIGIGKPGVLATNKGVNVGAGTASTVSFATTSASGGPAPTYDEFVDAGNTGTEWQTNFDALSLLNNAYPPTVTQPGYDVSGMGSTIPSDSVTVTPSGAERAGILTKARFNKFASVNAARLISAVAPTPNVTTDPTVAPGTLPNAIMHLNGNPQNDVTKLDYSQYVELDVEGYAKVNDGSNGGAGSIHPAYRIFGQGEVTRGPLPVAGIQTLADVSPTKPLDYEIVRTGTYYDFYFNGIRVFGANFPSAVAYDNHKIFLYDYYPSGNMTGLTWDWVKAGPLAAAAVSRGDLNGNGLVDFGDAVRALQLSGGLDIASATDKTNGTLTGDSSLSIADAVAIAQEAAK